jgi:c-di-GMP-binding flagellar brake protein YcgR
MEERRAYRRLDLRLPILVQPSPAKAEGLTTSNISAGGMYFQVPGGGAPQVGSHVAFELVVPPGAGYSASAGRIKGRGEIVRTDSGEGEAAGVAVRFTETLAMRF